jgi:hypothetical protein
LDNSPSGITADGSGNLYATGLFQNAGGIATNYIAKWDGANWSALGAGLGLGTSGSCLLLDGTTLYVGGYFKTAFEDATIRRLARLDLRTTITSESLKYSVPAALLSSIISSYLKSSGTIDAHLVLRFYDSAGIYISEHDLGSETGLASWAYKAHTDTSAIPATAYTVTFGVRGNFTVGTAGSLWFDTVSLKFTTQNFTADGTPITQPDRVSAPAAPAVGNHMLYPTSDGWVTQDSLGNIILLTFANMSPALDYAIPPGYCQIISSPFSPTGIVTIGAGAILEVI